MREWKPTALEAVLWNATKTAAKEAGSVEALAKMVDIPRSVLWRYLDDGRTLSLHTAGKLAAGLGYELTRKGE